MTAASAASGVQVGDILSGQVPDCNLGAFGLAPHPHLPPQNIQKEVETEKESVVAADPVESVAASVDYPPRPQATIGRVIQVMEF